MKLLFLDTETTGNELGKDRLCQVCYKTGTKTHTEYFKPPIPMSVKSMSITHITNKMLEGKAPFEGSEMQRNIKDLLKNHALVAHNAKFDISMLEAEGISVPNFICTLRLARYLDENSVIPEYNLQYLRYYLDLEIEGSAHDALGDVLVTEAIFNRQLQKFLDQGINEEEAIAKMIEISSKPSIYKKIPFGKHKDEMLEEVTKTDRSYLEWLYKQKMEDGEQDEDWLYTLKHYLGK